jgi:hypothetical protein
MRDAQYKMQRDMSQSFMDGPSKPAAKKPVAAATEAAPKPATKPAAKDAAKPAAKDAGGDSVSGA